MLIELEYPFCLDWSKGYLRTCKKDGRTRLDLVNSMDDRTTIAYARYLLGVNIGRYLTDNEEADHIDNDCTNDSLDNLQVLTIEEHKAKTKAHIEGRTYFDCRCAYCGKEFQREKRHMRGLKTLCSRSCNAKYNREFGSWSGLSSGHTEDDLETIAEFRKTGLSDYAIAPLMGMHRSKIQRLRKLNNIPNPSSRSAYSIGLSITHFLWVFLFPPDKESSLFHIDVKERVRVKVPQSLFKNSLQLAGTGSYHIKWEERPCGM